MHLTFTVRCLCLVLATLFPVSAAAQSAGSPDDGASFDASVKAASSGPGEVLPNALYVKLRNVPPTRSPREMALAAVRRAGLNVEDASGFGALNVPLSNSVVAYRIAQSSERESAIDAAEAELRRIVLVRYRDDVEPEAAAAMVSRMNDVEYAEPVGVPHLLGSPSEPNDPMLGEQTSLQLIRAIEAWQIESGDTSVVIGIVDGGINMYHVDLRGNIAENPGESGLDNMGNDRATNRIDDDANGVVDDWRGANLTHQIDGTTPGITVGGEHGTQVAGLAAATTNNDTGIAGVANQSRFFPVKAASLGSLALIEAYNGILYCARRGFSVINCSFGSSNYSQVEQDIVRLATLAYDAAVVAAGGNDPSEGRVYPAAYRYVMAVAALDENLRVPGTWGDHIDVTSPSGKGTSDTITYYNLAPASSYAAPIASGVVSLVRSRWPELSARQALAHVRLTAVDVDAANPGRERLIGHGRVDALNAVSVDPLSRPGIVVDSIWLTSEGGEPVSGFGQGDKGRFAFAITNLLGPASNVRLRVLHYTSDSVAIRFDTAAIAIAQLATGQHVDTLSVPFDVVKSDDGETRLRIEIVADGYNDYAYEATSIYVPYRVYGNDRLRVSLTEDARIGFDFRDFGKVGQGISFDGRPHLFEGGVLIAAGQERIVDNVRSDGANMAQVEDFVVVESPSAANDYTLTVRDDDAPDDRRIGLEVAMRVRTIDPVKNAAGIELRVKNLSSAPIDSLRVGYFFDWDVDGFYQGQRVNHVTDPQIPGAGLLGIVTNPVGSRIATAVAGEVPAPIFYGIDVKGDPTRIDDDFNEYEKFRVLANGIGRGAAGASDIAQVIGKTLVDVQPLQEDTVLLVLGFSNDLDQEAFDGVADFLEALTSDVIAIGSGSDLAIRGSVIGDELLVHVGSALSPDAVLDVVDMLGRTVAPSTTLRDLRGSTARIDLSGLPEGAYILRVQGGGERIARPFMVVR